MECIVTGKTKMKKGKVCMSLYNESSGSYIRPLKPDREYFTEEEVAQIDLFSIVEIEESPNQEDNTVPHVEDTIISSLTCLTNDPDKFLDEDEIEDFLAGIAVESADDIFGYDEDDNPYLILDNRNWGLRPNTGERSLGTVEVTWVKIYKDYYDKVRVDFEDVSGKTYTHAPLVIQATDDEIDSMLGEFNAEDYDSMYLRLSLARPYHADAWEDWLCALQVSNVNVFSEVYEY
ncbi:hypothetical protein AMS59_04550 [Lysinibacillus sp. FJAT-14745]|uniref:dual OB domain-containing protein n=1 Tax=Lysinibacillus sp. FJAT-14745 TaxID=1704289 RepID=UPI0006ABE12F|nr:hypothetical protein [Lysinibacillus sp. FJAT-14745]KOP80648.1 hypothetical protein AMS59_04550 [Lysinibacillus sp. FJAT-14745]